MNRTLAIALIAVGAVLAVLGILQHQLIIRIHIDHLAVVLLAIGVIVMVAGIFGLVMQGRGAPLQRRDQIPNFPVQRLRNKRRQSVVSGE